MSLKENRNNLREWINYIVFFRKFIFVAVCFVFGVFGGREKWLKGWIGLGLSFCFVFY